MVPENRDIPTPPGLTEWQPDANVQVPFGMYLQGQIEMSKLIDGHANENQLIANETEETALLLMGENGFMGDIDACLQWTINKLSKEFNVVPSTFLIERCRTSLEYANLILQGNYAGAGRKNAIDKWSKMTDSDRIEFGIPLLDKQLGGLYPSEMLAITGSPGSMKTSLALKIIDNSIAKKRRALFFSLDMSKDAIECRRLMHVLECGQTEIMEMARFPGGRLKLDKANSD